MDEAGLRRLLNEVAEGTIGADAAVAALAHLPFASLDGLRIDHHRAVRTGMAESVYAPGKAIDHLVAAAIELFNATDAPVVVSRATPSQVEVLAASLDAVAGEPVVTPGPMQGGGPSFTVVWRPAAERAARVVVAAAGTSDLAVANECAAVLTAHGVVPTRIDDVGVAGLHRLLAETAVLQAADAVVAVAGMEGALASVVGGLIAAPVVAVPTSAGYGVSLEGVTALLAMLASCAPGVGVVGIDNGFGAACVVLRHVTAIERSAARPVAVDGLLGTD
jgi:pyridinium-3,5-biscarboxylic acid mononucleotide synthase